MSDLAKFIERVESLIRDRMALDEDIKEVLKEAKDADFDPAMIRKVATIAAKQTAPKIAKERAKLDEYAAQIGLDFDVPSGVPGGKKEFPQGAGRNVSVDPRLHTASRSGEGQRQKGPRESASHRTVAVGDVQRDCSGAHGPDASGNQADQGAPGRTVEARHLDHGRAAPRAAGISAASESSAAGDASRPVASPASPDPHPQVDVSPSQHCVECGCEVTPLDAMVLGTKRPLCQPCFVSLTGRFAEGRDPLDSPPDIPRFLDRRESAA